MLDQEKIYQNKLKFMELLTKLNVDLTEFSKFLDAVDYYNNLLLRHTLKLIKAVYVNML